MGTKVATRLRPAVRALSSLFGLAAAWHSSVPLRFSNGIVIYFSWAGDVLVLLIYMVLLRVEQP